MEVIPGSPLRAPRAATGRATERRPGTRPAIAAAGRLHSLRRTPEALAQPLKFRPSSNGELDTAQTELVEFRFEQVERMLLYRIPQLFKRVAAGGLDEEDVRDIEEADAVYRVVRNP